MSKRAGVMSVAVSLVLTIAAAAQPRFQTGDVLELSERGGEIRWRDASGAYLRTIYTDGTDGMRFDPQGNLWVANWDGTISVYDSSGSNPVSYAAEVDTPRGHYAQLLPESVAFAGDLAYVGGELGDLLVFSLSQRRFVDGYKAGVDFPWWGIDDVEVSCDGRTLYYTTENAFSQGWGALGPITVQRFDLPTRTPLPPVGTLPGVSIASGGETYPAFVRLLPGEQELLVAAFGAVYRQSTATGQILKTYDAPGVFQWFNLTLTQDGASFWSGDAFPDCREGQPCSAPTLYKFDTATGAILAAIDTGRSVSSVAVFGDNFPCGAPSCPADLTGDGVLDFADQLEFLNLFDALDPRVDFNHDGVIDFGDYLEFLNLFDAGC